MPLLTRDHGKLIAFTVLRAFCRATLLLVIQLAITTAKAAVQYANKPAHGYIGSDRLVSVAVDSMGYGAQAQR